jgi:hypothetical protein
VGVPRPLSLLITSLRGGGHYIELPNVKGGIKFKQEDTLQYQERVELSILAPSFHLLILSLYFKALKYTVKASVKIKVIKG